MVPLVLARNATALVSQHPRTRDARDRRSVVDLQEVPDERERHDQDEYQRFPSFWPDPQLRKWNVWGYVDVRDVATACRLGLEAEVTGSQNVIIAAADTVMNRPSRDVLAEVFPGVPVIGDVAEFGTLLAIDRARDLLGYEPAHSWRDHLKP